MKVLLFGGAGYIGTHVAMAFMDRGDHVGIYDNLSSGLRSNVSKDAKFFEGDILDDARELAVGDKARVQAPNAEDQLRTVHGSPPYACLGSSRSRKPSPK